MKLVTKTLPTILAFGLFAAGQAVADDPAAGLQFGVTNTVIVNDAGQVEQNLDQVMLAADTQRTTDKNLDQVMFAGDTEQNKTPGFNDIKNFSNINVK